MNIMIIGGHTGLMQGSFGRKLVEYNLNPKWVVFKNPNLVSLPKDCEGVLLIKNIIGHNLADIAVAEAKARKIPFAAVTSKFQQALPILRQNGFITADAQPKQISSHIVVWSGADESLSVSEKTQDTPSAEFVLEAVRLVMHDDPTLNPLSEQVRNTVQGILMQPPSQEDYSKAVSAVWKEFRGMSHSTKLTRNADQEKILRAFLCKFQSAFFEEQGKWPERTMIQAASDSIFGPMTYNQESIVEARQEHLNAVQKEKTLVSNTVPVPPVKSLVVMAPVGAETPQSVTTLYPKYAEYCKQNNIAPFQVTSLHKAVQRGTLPSTKLDGPSRKVLLSDAIAYTKNRAPLGHTRAPLPATTTLSKEIVVETPVSQDKMVMLRHHQEEYKQGCLARGVQPYHYNHVSDMLFRGKIFGEKRENAWYVNMASLIDDTVTRRQELEGQMLFGKTFTATPLAATSTVTPVTTIQDAMNNTPPVFIGAPQIVAPQIGVPVLPSVTVTPYNGNNLPLIPVAPSPVPMATGTLKAQVIIPVNAEALKLIEDLVRVGAQVQLLYQ